MKKKWYNVRWALAGHPSIASVSFEASHDANAKRKADRVARELGVTNTPRTITTLPGGPETGGRVVEVISKGVGNG